MSQVSDLMDELSDRITADKIPTLYTALNRAVRILSKRLFILDSDLITDVLSIPIYLQVSYTAATIAFVKGKDGNPDTITDSAGQFVIEGFKAGMGVYSDCPGNYNALYIDTVTAGTITLRASDSVFPTGAGVSYTLQSENDYGNLPEDFWGLLDKPYVLGQKDPLTPLPNQETLLQYRNTDGGFVTGQPRYYTLIQDKIGIIPATSADIIISGFYYKKPTKIIGMDDYLPYNELFDDVIIEYLLAVLGKGATGATELSTILTTEVDLVCSKRGKRAPKPIPPGINYENIKT